MRRNPAAPTDQRSGEAPPIVTFAGVDKTYDGTSFIVRDLDLSVRAGEFLSLLGPSGSGKTTTLMMLAGFETPSNGEIRLAGKRLNDDPPHRRNIGVVFQNYALFPHMSVAENVAFPLSVRRVPRAERRERVRRALAAVELPHLEDRRPAQLSGGQQQRVALARAMVFEPAVILMDEPLGALDKRLRETMQLEIRRLHRALGATILYVTHDQSEALTMSDRVAVFHDGRVQQVAPPDELYENPANAFVADFIGENNGLKGRVVDLADGRAALDVPGAGIVRGRADPRLPLGGDGVLALRPERAVILDGGPPAARPDWNSLAGAVEDVAYFGDHERVLVAVPDRQTFVLKIPNTGGRRVPAIGEHVRVGWPVEDCKIVA